MGLAPVGLAPVGLAPVGLRLRGAPPHTPQGPAALDPFAGAAPLRGAILRGAILRGAILREQPCGEARFLLAVNDEVSRVIFDEKPYTRLNPNRRESLVFERKFQIFFPAYPRATSSSIKS